MILIMRLTWAGLAQDAASIGAISVKLLGEGPAMSLVKHLSLGSHNLRGQRITTCRLCSFALALWAKAAPSLQAGPASWTHHPKRSLRGSAVSLQRARLVLQAGTIGADRAAARQPTANPSAD